ncbi:hypothetical protein [Streptomyces sp. AC550_RSS872]|uniref:hypothetical protein n=1 Tax=Streptomyces sp. AC550_RSS872 TaxID=2823689 RepID=UPI0020B7BD3F|nr:hypothetical protein [Streptomyces sp. AC550_RSS872]
MRPPTAELEHQNSTVLTADEPRTPYAGTFGLVGDLPETAATGCGLRVPHAGLLAARECHLPGLP